LIKLSCLNGEKIQIGRVLKLKLNKNTECDLDSTNLECVSLFEYEINQKCNGRTRCSTNRKNIQIFYSCINCKLNVNSFKNDVLT
jgi:hypothetical protein